MGEVISLNSQNQVQRQRDKENIDILEIANEILFDTHASIANRRVVSMPIAELATLGATVSSLLPTFRTITETTVADTDGLYRLVNAGAGDILKVAKDQNCWGALKSVEGKSKLAKFQPVHASSVTTTTVFPLDPATIMIAVALFSIEQKLGNIETMQKQILSFLENEKQTEIVSQIETMSFVLRNYKLSWDNELFISGHHNQVIDIKKKSRQQILSYQNNINNVINMKKRVVVRSKVNDVMSDLAREFKYYRLALYSFSMASFIEIMLSGEFKEKRFIDAKEEIERYSVTYREIFEQCSVYLEKMIDSTIGISLAKGIGNTGSAVGKFIENIPVIREGSVDEFLQEKGAQLKKDALLNERKVIEAFAEIGNPGVGIFIEKLEDMVRIYGYTQEIYFDNKMIYLVAE